MLHIYTDRKYVPSGDIVIEDADAFSIKLNLMLDDVTRRILSEIEQATPINKQRVLDRFDTALYASDMSTTSKILIAAYQFDYVMRADELGMNAYSCFRFLPKGKFLFVSALPDLRECIYPIYVNNIKCVTYEQTWGYKGEILC